MASTGIVYLMYHELQIPGHELCQSEQGYIRYVVAASDFREQLAHLRTNGFCGLSVSEALEQVDQEQPSIVITFDDGCETDLLTAAPLLREYGFNATFYILAGSVGRRGYLSAAQLRELSDLGFAIGCHSMTHRHLTDLDPDQLQIEIAQSKDKLAQLIGRRIDHFSCPNGRWSRRVACVARDAGYRSVATSRIGTNSQATDHFRLARVPVLRGTTMADFDRLCHSRGLIFRQMRGTTLATAKALLGNSMYDKLRSIILIQRSY